MTIFTLKKHLFATVAGVVLAMGFASAAQASFMVNPSALGVTGLSFSADAITGSSSELLHILKNDNHVVTGHFGKGIIHYGYFNAGPTFKFLNGNYGIYVKFNLVDTVGSPENILTTLTYDMYADMGNDDTFTSAGSDNGSGTEATVTNTFGDEWLASGSLISGLAHFNGLGGVGLNSNTTFNLTPLGESFFTMLSPSPFFSVALNGFNNQSGGAVFNDDQTTITINAGGVTSFTSFAVPEPTSVALLGLGLLGLGATGRRRRKN